MSEMLLSLIPILLEIHDAKIRYKTCILNSIYLSENLNDSFPKMIN